MLGSVPRSQGASLSPCLSLLFSQRAVKPGSCLTCLCNSDYAALGSAGNNIFSSCGPHWGGCGHQPRTPSTAPQLQQGLPAARAHTLLPLQQQEGRQAMSSGPTLPFQSKLWTRDILYILQYDYINNHIHFNYIMGFVSWLIIYSFSNDLISVIRMCTLLSCSELEDSKDGPSSLFCGVTDST